MPPVHSTTAIRPPLQRQQSEQTDMEVPISQSQEPKHHQFVKFEKSIGDLAALSAAIDAFKRQFDDMQNHIELIQNAIDSRLAEAGGVFGASSSSVSPPQIDAEGNELPPDPAATVTESSEKPEAQGLCESMCSKGLRKYILTNLADTGKLMEEIPEALNLAQDPSKLVFECIGRFYLQGRKAFTKNSPMIASRMASLVVMECFLLMAGCDDAKTMIESSIKVAAEEAALAWRKRLMTEGGLANADPMDARGLLLLIACFGVPSNFGTMTLLDLVLQSKAFEISGALRRSPFLAPLIPGIIDASIKRGMHVDAVELVYTFGLEDKFSPPSILISFLRMNKEAFEKAKRMAHSPVALREANQAQVTALRSVVRCLEIRNLDPAKVLSGWQIKSQIIKLDKDIFALDKEIEENTRSIRTMEEPILAERLYSQEMKRPRLSGMERPLPVSSYSPIYHDRSFRNRGNGDDISALVSTYLSSPSSFPHRSSSLRSSHESMAGHGLGRGLSAFEPHMGGHGNLPSGVYSPSRGQSFSRQLSPIRRDSLSQQYSPIGGQGLSGQQMSLGMRRAFRDSPSIERYAGLPRHSSRGNSPSERFAGLRNHSFRGHSPSD